jgi:hypothetical protein
MLYDSDCYDHAITKFEYRKDTIIQHNMLNDSTYSPGIECGEPAKIMYILENGRIKKCISYLDYSQYLNGRFPIDPSFKKQLKIEKKKNKGGIEVNYDFIQGYLFSSAKYHGYLPISLNFKASKYYLPYSEVAKNSIFSIINCEYLNEIY